METKVLTFSAAQYFIYRTEGITVVLLYDDALPFTEPHAKLLLLWIGILQKKHSMFQPS
jgi:hypothetical protein